MLAWLIYGIISFWGFHNFMKAEKYNGNVLWLSIFAAAELPFIVISCHLMGLIFGK